MNVARLVAALLTVSSVGACSSGAPEKNEAWIAQIGGLGPEIVFDITETDDQRICATGTFYNTTEFGAGERTLELTADEIQDIFLACYDEKGRLESAVQFGAELGDEPRAIAALPGGDVVITGYFAHSFGAGKSATISTENNPEIFLSRLAPGGKEVWTRRIGGRLADIGNALAVTPAGNIFLAGSFQDVLLYEAGDKTQKLVSAGNRDAFVLKLTPDGEAIWGRRFGGAGRDEAQKIAIGVDGRVFVAGSFRDEASLDDGQAVMSAAGNTDAFLIAFEDNGDFAWSKQVAGSNREHVSGLVTSQDGHVYMSGGFLQSIVLPNGEGLESAGSSDIFLMGFNQEGTQLWGHRLGGEQVDDALDLAITQRGTLLLAGYFQGRADFAPGPREYFLDPFTQGNSDAFLVELDADSSVISAIRAGGAGVEMAFAVVALANGDIAASGLFNQNIAFGPGGLEELQKRGKTDAFLVRFHPDSMSNP